MKIHTSPAEQPNQTNSSANHLSVFLLIWWMSFLAYPLWYLPAPDSTRMIACILLFAIFTGCSWMFRLLTRWNSHWGETPEESTIPALFFILLFVITFAAHIPFLFGPIQTGLDTIDHAAVPAVIAQKTVRAISGILNFSIQPFLTALTLFLCASVLFIKQVRTCAKNASIRVSQWIHARYWTTIGILAVITIVYAAFLLTIKPLDGFDDLNPLFRYPPLSKFFSIPLYLGFGLYEWPGRVMQTAFTFGTAVYLYCITRLYAGIIAGQAAAVLLVLLPPVFHYGNTTMLEGGTLFFMTAAFFYWIRYIEHKSQSDLIAGTLFAALACLYKHPGVSLIPAFAFMAGYDFLFPKKKRTFQYIVPSVIACAIPAITIVLFMKLSGFNSDVPSSLQIPTAQYLWGNLQAMPKGITTPVALLFLFGFTALPWTKSWRTFWIFFGWIGAHYLLTCMSAAAMNVRQALPYYIGLIVPASILIESVTAGRKWMQTGVVYILMPLFLLWACLWMDRNQDYKKVGRAMGDLSYINFSNWNSMYLPYPQTVSALKEITSPGDVIYAPMINEPVLFYIEKYGLIDRPYHRELWADFSHQNVESLLAYCKEIHAKWLVVPRGRWLYDAYADMQWIERIFTNPPESLIPIQVVSYGTEQIGIWQIQNSAGK